MDTYTPRPRNCLRWISLSLVIVLLDQWTKLLALRFLTPNHAKVIFPFLNLILTFNTGAAFSFLRGQGPFAMWLLIGIAAIASIIILFFLARLPTTRVLLACALSLILGGALGNLVDRVYHGFVIDFIQLHIHQYAWPVFNVADSAISLGAVLLCIDILRAKRSPP